MTKDTVPQVNEICRISRNTQMTGDLISSSDIRIDGKFTGKICTKAKIVIGEASVVEGIVLCQSADIWGEVKGDVYVEEAITLKSSAKLTGTLKSSKLCIEMGAIFNGPCNIIGVQEFKKISDEFLPGGHEESKEAPALKK